MKKLAYIIIPCLFIAAFGFLFFQNQQEPLPETSKAVTQKPLKQRTPAQTTDWGDYLKEQASGYYTSSWNPSKIFRTLSEDDSWQGGAWQCIEKLKNFAYVNVRPGRRGRLIDRPDDSFGFGFEVSDQQYQNDNRLGENHYELPKRIQDDLDGSDSEFWNKQKWRKWDNLDISGEKWSVLQYRSRTVMNPGGSPRSLQRVLVLREVDKGGEKYDQWIQFTVHPAGTNELDPTPTNSKPLNPVGKGVQKLVDFISVRFKDQHGEYEKPLLSFRQFWRDSQGFNPKDRLAETGGLDTCYSCHANGMRWVSPYPGSVWSEKLASGSEKTQKETLDHYTDRMNGYGQTSWGNAIHPESYGPPLGKKVGCAECHNNWSADGVASMNRGAINWGFSPGHTYHKMSVNATMPMNDRGAHGVARSFINDFTSGNKNKGIKGDKKRAIYHKWLSGQGRSNGAYPDLSQAISDIKSTDLGDDESLKDENLKKAAAAARYAENSNKDYRKFLLTSGGQSYSQNYKRQTRDWLLSICDQEASEESLLSQETGFTGINETNPASNSQVE